MSHLLIVNPYLLLAIALAGWSGWRLIRWLGSGGRFPLRGRRGTASGFAAAGLSVEAFYRPSVQHVIEAKQREQMQREDDAEGDPPDTGLE